jgi:ubiquinone/menaquinone biosynthesis C-methylase UbiE
VIKSKAWDWKIASAPWWKDAAAEVYPLLKRWGAQGFKRILDLGCGIGRHSILFAENGFEVDAFDLSKEGIKQLNELIRQKKLTIKTTVGDMLSLPYEDKSFDCLLAYHAVYHTDDEGIRKVINEIGRVLVNDGEAFVTFNSQESSAYKDSKNQRITTNTIIKAKDHEVGMPHYYATKQDVENLLRGFQIVEFLHKEEFYPDYTGAHYFVLVKKP